MSLKTAQEAVQVKQTKRRCVASQRQDIEAERHATSSCGTGKLTCVLPCVLPCVLSCVDLLSPKMPCCCDPECHLRCTGIPHMCCVAKCNVELLYGQLACKLLPFAWVMLTYWEVIISRNLCLKTTHEYQVEDLVVSRQEKLCVGYD